VNELFALLIDRIEKQEMADFLTIVCTPNDKAEDIMENESDAILEENGHEAHDM